MSRLSGNLNGPFPEDDGLLAQPSYRFSMNADGISGVARDSVRLSQSRGSDTGGSLTPRSQSEVFIRGSLIDRNIEAIAVSTEMRPERTRDYKGRIRIWPGVILLFMLIGVGGFLISYYGKKAYDQSQARAQVFSSNTFKSSQIKGGRNGSFGDLVDDDGVVGNPKKYPPSVCELPDYQSKDGHIVAVSTNGTEVKLKIKGINWFGMETGQAIPFGLWENEMNGTNVYQIATFLAANKFNAVRLPLMVAYILNNRAPNDALINKQTNRAINLKSYMSLLKSIVQALAYRNIGVLLSMHTLTAKDNGDLWYNKDISEDDFLKAIDVLTDNLCSSDYWNIMGIDLKNEPFHGTWGSGTATDFEAGSKRIANRMLKGCSNWMGFIEGVNSQHSITIDGKAYGYYDWFGGGLQGAKHGGIEFSIPNKVVWAPHYYTPAVFPQYYLFGGGEVGAGNVINDYVELSDEDLRHHIKATTDDMFGFLASETGAALVLGEFGGLYSKDAHPLKTTRRCTDFTIELIKKPGYAGGFVWSLNPESAYQYNPADTPGHFTEGILNDDWLQANTEFLKGMAAMDEMDNLAPFPCFLNKTKTL